MRRRDAARATGQGGSRVELVAGVLQPEAADPFGEPMTLLELEPVLRSQLDDAERHSEALAGMMAYAPTGAWLD